MYFGELLRLHRDGGQQARYVFEGEQGLLFVRDVEGPVIVQLFASRDGKEHATGAPDPVFTLHVFNLRSIVRVRCKVPDSYPCYQ